ncbi:MAG TPA: hypothetical protein VJ953_21625 [Saprospiraceae bacterium]|nr:hypothetical protein [Saprospiraceae bacterium]
MDEILISGIFNYCDRWCERCSFTDRCAIFEAEEDFIKVESAAFFHLLEQRLKDTITRVEKRIRTEAPELWEDWQLKIKALDTPQAELPEIEEELIQLSRKYFMSGRNWFKTNEPRLSKRRTEWGEQIKMGMDGQHQLDQLEDALAVIQWYQPFIGAKVHRAITGKNKDWQPEQERHQNDANGSAKIALLAIDRSLSSWELIRQFVPEVSDDLLDLLVQLSKLRSGMRVLFPKTALFIRPGFDELGNARSDS